MFNYDNLNRYEGMEINEFTDLFTADAEYNDVWQEEDNSNAYWAETYYGTEYEIITKDNIIVTIKEQ